MVCMLYNVAAYVEQLKSVTSISVRRLPSSMLTLDSDLH